MKRTITIATLFVLLFTLAASVDQLERFGNVADLRPFSVNV